MIHLNVSESSTFIMIIKFHDKLSHPFLPFPLISTLAKGTRIIKKIQKSKREISFCVKILYVIIIKSFLLQFIHAILHISTALTSTHLSHVNHKNSEKSWTSFRFISYVTFQGIWYHSYLSQHYKYDVFGSIAVWNGMAMRGWSPEEELQLRNPLAAAVSTQAQQRESFSLSFSWEKV